MKEGTSFFIPRLGLFLHLSTDGEHHGETQVCLHSSPPDMNLLESLLQALQGFQKPLVFQEVLPSPLLPGNLLQTPVPEHPCHCCPQTTQKEAMR